jgi:hypothetical protein
MPRIKARNSSWRLLELVLQFAQHPPHIVDGNAQIVEYRVQLSIQFLIGEYEAPIRLK